MTDRPISLKSVIFKIKSIAKEKFNDKLYENITTIYQDLNEVEQRVLMRGLVNICFIMEDRVFMDSEDITDIKQTLSTTKKSIDQIEYINKVKLARELIELKKLFIKSMLIFGSILGTLLLVYYSVFISKDNSLINMMGSLFKFLSGLF